LEITLNDLLNKIADKFCCKKLSRKQQEINNRKNLVLDVARKILSTDGFAGLSMDKIAKEIQCSKGTIYLHYANKEEIVADLCTCCIDSHIDFFQKVANYEGSTRQKIIAIFFTYQLLNRLHPDDFKNMQIMRSSHILAKLQPATLEQIKKKEVLVIGIINNIIKKAFDNKELIPPKSISSEKILYGLWSQVYGGALLATTDINWQNLGVDDTDSATLSMINSTLDGLNWQPLSDAIDCNKIKADLQNNIFADEYERLHNNM